MSSFWNSPAWSMGKRSASNNKKIGATNPGPGNYNSSATLSKHNPAWKIGGAPRNSAKNNEGPGPGNYNLSNSKSGPKITISSKPKTNSLGETLAPGPGNYNITTDGVYKNPSAFTMGAKYGEKIDDPQPGPGAYNAGTQFKNNGPKIGTSKRGELRTGNSQPGPGQYSYGRPFSAGPKYGFGNEMKSHGTLDQRPGPGQYEINDKSNSRVKGCTISEKFNKKNGIVSVPGPGAYQLTLTRPMSGTKIGRAERNNNIGTYGPGPGAYDFGFKAKTSSQIKIGTGLRQDFSKNETPGPGAYEYSKNAAKGVTISGYKGRQDIDISPGPGSYDLHEILQRPCSAKIGKSVRSNINIGDTPGPGQYYPKQPTNYKFAYSKQPRSKDLKGGDPGPGQYQIPPSVPCAPHYLIDPSIYKSYG